MSSQKSEDKGFLQEEYEKAVSNRESDDENESNLGSFLEDQLDDESEKEEGIFDSLENQLSDESKREDERFTKTDNYSPQVYFHSSETMPELDDESVHMAITSPPYNTGWEYGDYDDNLDYATEYLPMLARVFNEIHRVLVPGGRFLVNVPSLLRSGSSGGFPIASDISRLMSNGDNIGLRFVEDGMHGSADMQFEGLDDIDKLRATTDWVIRETIAWNKGFNTDGLAPNGSFPRPWGVLLNNMHEVILVFQKPGTRDFDDMDPDIIERSKINKRDADMCDDVWDIHPDSWSPKYIDGQDIPVFPEKLVRRAIQLWTYEEDIVLDPFAGRFTTGKVAKQERRHGVGYELREQLKKDIEEYTHKNQTGLFQFEE